MLPGGSQTDVRVLFQKGLTYVTMTRDELKCMSPLAWLNDKVQELCCVLLSPVQVIQIYILLLVAMRESNPGLPDVRLLKNSFFYTKLVQLGDYTFQNVSSWTRTNQNLLLSDKILIPINKDQNHWVHTACTPRIQLVLGACSDQSPRQAIRILRRDAKSEK